MSLVKEMTRLGGSVIPSESESRPSMPSLSRFDVGSTRGNEPSCSLVSHPFPLPPNPILCRLNWLPHSTHGLSFIFQPRNSHTSLWRATTSSLGDKGRSSRPAFTAQVQATITKPAYVHFSKTGKSKRPRHPRLSLIPFIAAGWYQLSTSL